MKTYVIFHKAGKIVAVDEFDADRVNWVDATFLKAVQTKRMNPRILQKIMNKVE